MSKPFSYSIKTVVFLLGIITFSTRSFSQTTVRLEWPAFSNQEVDYYIVERGIDSDSFVYNNLIKVRAGIKKATFHASDNVSLIKSPVVYYRLKIISIQAKVSYSSVVAIPLNGNETQGTEIISNVVTDQLKATLTSRSKSKSLRKSSVKAAK
ncbi:MAG: hypothetical protein ABUT20_49980, partial [Bacteroidota bacterium]